MERLAVTLRFLASRDSYQSLSYLFKMSSQVISLIIIEICEALQIKLSDQVKVINFTKYLDNNCILINTFTKRKTFLYFYFEFEFNQS